MEEHRAEGSPYRAHMPALDGVRGLAVLGVMASHVFAGSAVTPLQRAAMWVFAFGTHGVDLFFALSGFLITGILYDTLHERKFFRKFFARRVLRIFPAYYLILFVFFVAGLLWHMHYGQRLLSLAVFLQNTYRIGPPIWIGADEQGLPLGPWWSVAVEEQFYVLWALAVFCLRGRKKILWTGVALSVMSFGLRVWARHHGVWYRDVYVGTIYRMDGLLLGGALAMLLRGPWHDRVLRWAGWVCGGTLVWVVIDAWWETRSWKPSPMRLSAEFSGMALLCAATLGVVLRGGLSAKVMAWRPLRWVGKYSYGAYLIHVAIWFYVGSRMRVWMGAHGLHGAAVSVGAGLTVMALALAVAWVMYEAWEKRFLRLKRYFAYEGAPRGGHS